MCVEVKRPSETQCVCVCVRLKPSCKKTPIEAHVQVPELDYITQLKQHVCLNTHTPTHTSCGYPLSKLIA